MMKVAIIDDEDSGRNIIHQYLSLYCDDIEIVGEANSVKSGVELLSKESPDVVFLDIQMQDGTGFNLLEALPERTFKVVFVTSFDQFALKAIKFCAADYILKPVDPDEFVNAVERVQAEVAQQNQSRDNRIDELLTNMNSFTKIGLPTDSGVQFVTVDDIMHCEAVGDNTLVYMKNGDKITASNSIKDYEELFADNKFMRVHKLHLVNTNHISKYISDEDGGNVIMSDGSSVVVSPLRKDDLQKILK